LENKGVITVRVKDKKDHGEDTYKDYIKSEINNFPWGVMKKHIESARKTYGPNNKLNEELSRAVLKIKDFIITSLG
jgi:hypothetical protein